MVIKLVLDISEEQATQIYETIDTKDEGSITYCKYSQLTIPVGVIGQTEVTIIYCYW